MDTDDKLDVAETLYRYATGVDRRDWSLLRSAFADTVIFDFASYAPGRLPQTMSADSWVAGIVPQFTGLNATQHSMTNPLAAVDGNSATITMYVRAHHVYDPNDPMSWYTVGGYYDNTLIRADGRWLLTGVRLAVTWRAGDPAIMELARIDGLAKLG